MLAVAWWLCALPVLAAGRIYERCELARELRALGIRHDHIPTWVCIAFHESRFDTAARNPHSGDHGLLQISELYWCGAGKACGLPCSALRDEDISDDVECAQKIYEEHTRIQGNGFLAWVVYPLYCKHSTKKYLADCDLVKYQNSTITKAVDRPRALNFYDRINNTAYNNTVYNVKIDELLPPYLTINSILRGKTEQQREQKSFGKDNSVKWRWQNFKFDNIDSLILPKLNHNASEFKISTTTSKTATTNANSVSFNKNVSGNYENQRKISTKLYEQVAFIEKETTKPSITTAAPATSITHISVFTTSTYRPNFPSVPSQRSTTNSFTTTVKPSSTSHTISRTTKPWSNSYTTSRTTKPWSTSYTTSKTTKPSSTSYNTSGITKPSSNSYTTSNTSKPWSTSYTTRRTTKTAVTHGRTIKTTNEPSFLIKYSVTTVKPEFLTPTFSSDSFARTEVHVKSKSTFKDLSSKSNITTSSRPPIASKAKTVSTSTTPKPTTARSTQSIFDLYLNPTKRPKLPAFTFSPLLSNRYKVNVFSDGTTTLYPPLKTSTEGSKAPVGGSARNHFRRETN